MLAQDTICEGFTNIHELWAVPVELGIALYLLERQLGLAFLAPCSVAIICTTGVLIIAKWIGNAKKVWMRGIQTRVDVTASMLGSMKVRLTHIKVAAYLANTHRKRPRKCLDIQTISAVWSKPFV